MPNPGSTGQENHLGRRLCLSMDLAGRHFASLGLRSEFASANRKQPRRSRPDLSTDTQPAVEGTAQRPVSMKLLEALCTRASDVSKPYLDLVDYRGESFLYDRVAVVAHSTGAIVARRALLKAGRLNSPGLRGHAWSCQHRPTVGADGCRSSPNLAERSVHTASAAGDVLSCLMTSRRAPQHSRTWLTAPPPPSMVELAI